MKKTLKWGGIVLLGLTGIFLLAVLFVNIYRKEILEAVNQKLKEEINGDIHIDKLGFTIFHDFPNASLSLQNIYMRGPRDKEFHQDFLKAELIDIQVEAMKLFRMEVSIKSVDIINGEIFMFKTRSGYTNLEILKRVGKKDTTSESQDGQVSFKDINLKNVAVSFHDSLKHKEFEIHFLNVRSTIAPGDSSTLFHLMGQVKFIGLMFKAEKGSYLKNTTAIADVKLEFNPHTHRLVIRPSSLKLEKSGIGLSGLFKLSEPQSFQLAIRADSLDYREGLSVLTKSLRSKLEKFSIEKKVNVNVIVGGSLISGAKPSVDMTFSLRNSKVSSDKFEMEPLTVRGSLTNHFDRTMDYDGRNMLLSLDTLYGKFNGLKFGGRLLVHDFENPQMNLKAKFDIELKLLNADTLSEINFKSGRFQSDFSFIGPLEEYLDGKRMKYKGQLNGGASITNGDIEYVAKQMSFEKVEAQVHFTNEQFRIKQISLEVNKNPITVKGLFTGYVPFFTQPGNRVKAVLSLTSPKFDVAQAFPKQKAKKGARKEKAIDKKRRISKLIDELYKKLELEMAIDIGQFSNKKFKSENLVGTILLSNDQLQVKSVRMKFGDGQVNFSASINQLQRNINPFTLAARVQNADISNFFYSFNNFNQTAIRHDNLSGKINADITLNAAINNDLDILTSKLRGDVIFKLRKGRLINFKPLQDVSSFLFKNRDLSDVRFGDITGRFKMNGADFDLSRMEVQSTLLTLYLEGRYSLKDSTDLGIQVPLSNLKSRDQHIPPENIGTDKKAGASIFLRAHKGKDGKTVISYDPFRKALKKSNGNKASAKKK